MTTRTVNVATVLGIGAMLCGVAAAKPASADERGRVDIKLARDLHVDLCFGARPVVRDYVVVDDHCHDARWIREYDYRWHRDHDHDRDHRR